MRTQLVVILLLLTFFSAFFFFSYSSKTNATSGRIIISQNNAFNKDKEVELAPGEDVFKS